MSTTSTTGYRIAEAARLSGFPAASLRYYEQIGLMPPTARSDSGYRFYNDRDIDRLRFIGRAKQLGCTLEEIAELAAAWDNDECGPVQHRLASLVGHKIKETQARITELVQLATELQTTAASLARTPQDGPCDEACGCMTLTDDDGPIPVTLITKAGRSTVEPAPIACSLGAGDTQARIAEWRSVLEHAVERTQLDEGVRIVLDESVPLSEVARLAVAEQDCCRFFGFSITVDGRGIALEVTAPADGIDMVTTVFGAAA
jgi:DNA-binding transcriptional MerR regulator